MGRVAPADSDDALRFAKLRGVRAMIETYPLERAADAYARMMSGNDVVIGVPGELSKVTLPGKCLVPPSGHKIMKKSAECRTGAL
jgi:hypothetical protein